MGTLYTPPSDDEPDPAADWVLPDDVFDKTKWSGPIDPRPSNNSQGLMQLTPGTFATTISNDRHGTTVTTAAANVVAEFNASSSRMSAMNDLMRKMLL